MDQTSTAPMTQTQIPSLFAAAMDAVVTFERPELFSVATSDGDVVLTHIPTQVTASLLDGQGTYEVEVFDPAEPFEFELQQFDDLDKVAEYLATWAVVVSA